VVSEAPSTSSTGPCSDSNVSVDRINDGGAGAACFVLVNDRSTLAIVVHPGHQVSKPYAAPGGQGVPGVPQTGLG